VFCSTRHRDPDAWIVCPSSRRSDRIDPTRQLTSRLLVMYWLQYNRFTGGMQVGPRRKRGGAEHDDIHVRAVMDALRRIVRALRISARAAEGRLGISGAQLFVLHQLANGGASSIDELAARTHTHQSSVSVVVSRLADRGLAVRRTAPDDARRTAIALTSAGR